jgi:hypothetical protein
VGQAQRASSQGCCIGHPTSWRRVPTQISVNPSPAHVAGRHHAPSGAAGPTAEQRSTPVHVGADKHHHGGREPLAQAGTLGLGGRSFKPLIASCQVHSWHLARSVVLPTIIRGTGSVHKNRRYQRGVPLVSGRATFQRVHVTVAPEAAKVEFASRLILALTIQNASSMVTRFHIDVADVPQRAGGLVIKPNSRKRAPTTSHVSTTCVLLIGAM